MDWLYHVDLGALFIPKESILQMVIRGVLIYSAAFLLLRVFRRQAGGVSISDLLVLVLIADAGSNGMTGEGFSITEAVVVVTTIVACDWGVDWLGYKSDLVTRKLEPEPVVLVKNGILQRENLAREMIREEELLGQLREQGVEDPSEVKMCRLERDGKLSVIKMEGDADQDNGNESAGVN